MVLAQIDAGDKRNAIAREGRAILVFPEAAESAVRRAAQECADSLLLHYKHNGIESEMDIRFTSVEARNDAYAVICSSNFDYLVHNKHRTFVPDSNDLVFVKGRHCFYGN